MKIAVAGATGRVGRHVVEVLEARGHEVVAVSRSHGVDVITGKGLADALVRVECIIDAASGPSPDQNAATEFFTTAARNLEQAGRRAGVKRSVVISIIGIDRFSAGYMAAKVAHERVALAGSIPVRILRAAQFHELVGQIVEWGRKGDASYLQEMRSQLVAARTVAEALADLATTGSVPGARATDRQFIEIAGPRPESLVNAARRLIARRGDALRIEEANNDADPDRAAYVSGALLPGPDAILGGPTFDAWLDSEYPRR